MRYPVSNLPKTIPVGVQTESGVEEIGIDVASWISKWPDMDLSVWLTRPGENASYPANNVHMDGTVLIWTPDAYDTERSGSGKFEILGRTKDGNKRKLTGNGVATMIRGTTLETTAEPGTAEIPWVEKVLSAAQEIKELLQYGPEHAGSMVYIRTRNIVSHKEAAAALYASNNRDTDHWMALFGDNMDAFRDRVAAMIGEDDTVRPTWAEMRRDTIRLGAKSHDVADLQGILIALGYDLGKLGADGNYGSATQKAVKKFQGDHELTPDGVAGPATWQKALALIEAIEGVDKPTVPPDEPQEPNEDSSGTPHLTVEERLTRLEEAVFGQEGGESDGS